MTNKSQTQFEVNGAVAIGIVGIVNVITQLATIAVARASSDADYNFVINSDWHNCQQIDADYQEVYAFETDSFYVNICARDGLYFYSGQAKQTDANSIFIPAIPLENQRGFKAINGNVSYIVILPFQSRNAAESLAAKPEEAILTIKRNDRLVDIEASLNKYCYQPKAIAFDNLELDLPNLNQLATMPQQQDINENLFEKELETSLPKEIFSSNSHFDFYRLDGKIHRLATCS